MMGQATIEFLFMSASMIAAVLLVSAVISEQDEVAKEKIAEIVLINKAESAARAIEAWLNTGVDMEFDFYDEHISYSIEGGNLHMSHGDDLIEIEGVFQHDSPEPL